MSLIKVGDRVVNLAAVEAIELNTGLNQVKITLLSGKSLSFDEEEANKLRAYFSTSKDVKDLMQS